MSNFSTWFPQDELINSVHIFSIHLELSRCRPWAALQLWVNIFRDKAVKIDEAALPPLCGLLFERYISKRQTFQLRSLEAVDIACSLCSGDGNVFKRNVLKDWAVPSMAGAVWHQAEKKKENRREFVR